MFPRAVPSGIAVHAGARRWDGPWIELAICAAAGAPGWRNGYCGHYPHANLLYSRLGRAGCKSADGGLHHGSCASGLPWITNLVGAETGGSGVHVVFDLLECAIGAGLVAPDNGASLTRRPVNGTDISAGLFAHMRPGDRPAMPFARRARHQHCPTMSRRTLIELN